MNQPVTQPVTRPVTAPAARVVSAAAGAALNLAALILAALLPAACLALGLGAAACRDDGAVEPAPLRRTGPLGSLRDLVLFERAADFGGPFFLDRFEVTRGDWREFAASAAGRAAGARPPPGADGDDAALPIAGVDLTQARRFARWRRCRLPRAEEWAFACTNDGRDKFPWGSIPNPARANTAELGLGAPLPVGTFESGRRADGPYDLIGNVAEWTETVPPTWFRRGLELLTPSATARERLGRTPGLTVWTAVASLQPPVFLVQAAGDLAPREVMGADFLSASDDRVQLRAPGGHSDTVGFRLCTSPRELLLALPFGAAVYEPDDLLQLERFLARGRHRAALQAALATVRLGDAERAFWASHLALP